MKLRYIFEATCDLVINNEAEKKTQRLTLQCKDEVVCMLGIRNGRELTYIISVQRIPVCKRRKKIQAAKDGGKT